MDRKRELTSVDCAALVTELGAYEGAKVDKAYLYGEDLLRLKLRDYDEGRLELLVEVGDVKRAHLVAPERVPDAPGRPPNFAMMLRNRISGADFAGVEQFGFDRILTFHFERPDGDSYVVAELFGEGNIAVLDENREVMGCLETIRLKSRTVAPGALYEYPSARLDPFALDEEGFAARMEESDTDVVRTLATLLNFGGLWAEELCTRAGVEKTKDIADAAEEDYARLFDAVERLETTLRTGAFDPRVYYADPESGGDGSEGGAEGAGDAGDAGEEEREPIRVDATPLPLEEREGQRAETFPNFNAALDDYFYHYEEEDGAGGGGASGRPDFEEEIAKYERIVAQQEGAIEGFDEQAQEERERAELLYARYDLVDEVLSAIRSAREEDVPWDDIAARFEEGRERGIAAAEAVEDVDGSNARVTLDLDGTRVTLDATTGVEKNADRLYREAKRVEEKKEGALEAIEDTREQLAAVRERRDEWEAGDAGDGDGDGEADEGGDEPVDWLSRASIPVRRDEQWYERFRWFRTSDGFLVLGGRNADQNEELVKKYTERGDLFFHTQAPGAPVTILKATEPSEAARDVDVPERSREEAAQFAVSYSSVWKDGHFAGDVYMVHPDQVSKTPESGEYVEKGSFVVRGDRTYYEDTPVGVSVGIACEPQTRVIGGPPSAIEPRAATSVRVEPGRYAQNDAAKLLYREFRERFADTSFVRKVASPDLIQEFLPPGGSRIVER
ncbi:ribosome rescue protein RqcH [Halomarina halobia]|uniref:Archaeal Rqc2 homolog aRqcH n=1 Tax=Halomarina halobia TaxID=3033386 RepID=A0ABD6A4V2_9EURY|nr:ribosome rescue protein RqcH [Halomarina sp. PSR21]